MHLRLVCLEKLFLGHNQIEDIFDHCFRGNMALRLLDVSNNLLQVRGGNCDSLQMVATPAM